MHQNKRSHHLFLNNVNIIERRHKKIVNLSELILKCVHYCWRKITEQKNRQTMNKTRDNYVTVSYISVTIQTHSFDYSVTFQ